MASYIDKVRAQYDITKIEKERAVAMQNLGTVVYNLYATGEVTIEQCREFYDEVSRCDDRVREIEVYLQQLEAQKLQQQQMAKNPYGYYNQQPFSQIPQTSPAQTVQPAQPAQAENTVFCTKCGTAVSATAKFCHGCGNPIQQ